MPDSPNDPDTSADLDTRLASLNERLGRHRTEKTRTESDTEKTVSGWGQAFKLSSEFIAAILVGTALGFGLDWATGLAPLFMILFLLLGFAAGVLNVLRSTGQVAKSSLHLAAARDLAEKDEPAEPEEPRKS